MSIRIVQLTDLHLFADPSGRLKGVPTQDALEEVLVFLESRGGSFDHLILTGDLAHDEELGTYVRLRELLSRWLSRLHLIPGNHDDRRWIGQVFGDLVASSDGSVTFSFATGGWRMIGLDSHLPGEVAGQIDPPQLDWLEAELADHAGEPTILFLHHPPVPVGSRWLDDIGLQQPERLIEIISASQQVQLVSAGHVHHEYEARIGNANFYTTPSTAIQFRPASDEPAYESAPPGYRVFTLERDAYHTEVVRLPELRYPPENGESPSGEGWNRTCRKPDDDL